MTRTCLALPVAGLLLGAACATAPATSPTADTGRADAVEAIAPGARAATASIRPEALAGHIRFLADDLLTGRAPGTPGHEIAARYVATRMQALGLEPAGEGGSWFQPVPLIGATLKKTVFEPHGGPGPTTPFVESTDIIGGSAWASGLLDVDAPLVFVGHGIQAPEYGFDSFQGVDVRGKIAVFALLAPLTDRQNFFPPLPSAVLGQPERIVAALKARGAVAAIGVWSPRLEGMFPFALYAKTSVFERMNLAEDASNLPTLSLSGPAFDRVLRQAGRTETLASLLDEAARGKPRAFELGLSAHVRIESALRRLVSPNVVGVLPGDPASPHAKELVVFGAHLDHLGVGPAVDGDTIYNGASDDAAGCASLLETARAFTRLPRRPARSILFLFVTAEEKGLLGSDHWARHPTRPLTDVVADIDVDAAYPLRPLRDVVAIGTDESTLLADVQRAAGALGLGIVPDPHPEEAYFVRSDNFNFVKRGILAAQTAHGASRDAAERAADEAFWKTHYHRPQDAYEPDRDWRPFADLTRFDFLLGLSIAQRPERPAWNPGSWFRRFPEPGTP